MGKWTVSHFFSPLLIITFLLAGCGGGEQADGQASGSGNEPALVSLSSLEFERAVPFLPDRMLPTTTVQLQVEALTSTNERIDASPLVSWLSSDASVVTVDENGLVTAAAEGVATVSAQWSRGGVNLVSRRSFQVRNANIELTADSSPVFAGDQLMLSVIARWDDGVWLNISDGLTLESNLPAIASFDTESDPYALTTHDTGTVVITARFLELSQPLEVVVNPAFSLTAEQVGINQVNLNWTPVANTTSYTVEWWTTGYFGLPVSAEIADISTTEYVHQDLATYSKYSYRIRAHLGFTSVTSPVTSITLPENNAATLQGSLIGSGQAPAHGQALRRTIEVVTGTVPETLQLGNAYLLRDRVRSPFETGNIVIPVTNISDWLVYCGVSASGREVRDVNGDAVGSTVITGFIFYGSLRDWGGSQPYNERCIAPGKTAYFITAMLYASAVDTAVSDFMDIASVFINEVSFWSFHNDPVRDAVIPQSYQIIPPNAENPNPRLVVTVTNVGESAVALYDTTSTVSTLYTHRYLLLDNNAEPLHVGQLTADPAWDGMLGRAESVNLSDEINFDASGSSIYVWTHFSTPPP